MIPFFLLLFLNLPFSKYKTLSKETNKNRKKEGFIPNFFRHVQKPEIIYFRQIKKSSLLQYFHIGRVRQCKKKLGNLMSDATEHKVLLVTITCNSSIGFLCINLNNYSWTNLSAHNCYIILRIIILT